VFGIGPQVGYTFSLGGATGVLERQGVQEFEAESRAEGWNAWLTFSISPAPTTR
jgi:hypothetical protein